jgi:hypothetical protein
MAITMQGANHHFDGAALTTTGELVVSATGGSE